MFLLSQLWLDLTNYSWNTCLFITLNPSDYKGRYSVSKLQKTDGGNKKTTHTSMRGREVCVDRRWMKGISYLEWSSVSSAPSHQDWTLLKSYSVASEPQKQQKPHYICVCMKHILLGHLWLKWDSVYVCTWTVTKAHTQTCTMWVHEFRITRWAALSYLNVSPLLVLQDIQPSVSPALFVSANAGTGTFSLSRDYTFAYLESISW